MELNDGVTISGDIKTEEELQKVIKYLENQGFHIKDSYWELHNRKIENIFNKANTLGIKYDNKELVDIKKVKNYDEAEKIAKKYFSKFNPDDKIYELLSSFYIEPDSFSDMPSYNSPSTGDVINWVDFRLKHNLKDIFKSDSFSARVEYINLDKNFIKIHFGNSWDFDKLYNLVFNEEPEKYSESKAGIWQDLGKIQIKIFSKGTAQIKGDITKLKEHYYKFIIDKKYNGLIIKYNGKTETFSPKE